MRVWMLGLCAAMALIGCNGGENTAATSTANPADANVGRESLYERFGSASTRALGVSSRSESQALASVRSELSELAKEFAQLKPSAQKDKETLATIALHAARIDAALNYQVLRTESESALKSGCARKSISTGDMVAARRTLRSADPEFDDLMDRTLASERAYVEATNRLRERLQLENALAEVLMGDVNGT